MYVFLPYFFSFFIPHLAKPLRKALCISLFIISLFNYVFKIAKIYSSEYDGEYKYNPRHYPYAFPAILYFASIQNINFYFPVDLVIPSSENGKLFISWYFTHPNLQNPHVGDKIHQFLIVIELT